MNKNTLHIGCHLSSSAGYLAMGKEAVRIGADTFAFFTRNPRGGNAKPMNVQDAEALRALLLEEQFAPFVAHAPYTYNLCSDSESNREFARRSMAEDLERLEYLPGNYYNFHPGSHRNQGMEEGIRMIAAALDEVMWDKAVGLATFHYFDIDALLSFVVRLEIIHRWLRLDEKTGQELFRRLVQEVRGTFKGVEFTDN